MLGTSDPAQRKSHHRAAHRCIGLPALTAPLRLQAGDGSPQRASPTLAPRRVPTPLCPVEPRLPCPSSRADTPTDHFPQEGPAERAQRLLTVDSVRPPTDTARPSRTW